MLPLKKKPAGASNLTVSSLRNKSRERLIEISVIVLAAAYPIPASLISLVSRRPTNVVRHAYVASTPITYSDFFRFFFLSWICFFILKPNHCVRFYWSQL